MMVIKQNSKILSTENILKLENNDRSKFFLVEYDEEKQLVRAVERSLVETNVKYLWRLTTDKGNYITTFYTEFLTSKNEWARLYDIKPETELVSIPYSCGVDFSQLFTENLVNGNANYGRIGTISTQKVKKISFAHRCSGYTSDSGNFIIFPESEDSDEGLVIR